MAAERWRTRLDIAAALAMLVASGALVYASLSKTGFPSRREVSRPEIKVPSDPISLEGAHFEGDPSAPLVLVEYSDFECPYCRRFAAQTRPALLEKYAAARKVRFGFRHLPLESIHRRAVPAAEAAECAGRQGRFAQMYAHLFEGPIRLAQADLLEAGKSLRLDMRAFQRCLTGEAAQVIQESIAEAARLNINSTPAFFLGRLSPEGRLIVSDAIKGARPLSDFVEIIDRSLSSISK